MYVFIIIILFREQKFLVLLRFEFVQREITFEGAFNLVNA